MADMDSKLVAIEAIFGRDLDDIPTTGVEALKSQVFEALLIIFSVTDDDLDVSKLDGFSGDKNAVKVNAQAPYKAMAHMLVQLAKGVPPAEGEDL